MGIEWIIGVHSIPIILREGKNSLKIYTASFKVIKKLENYCQLAVSSGLPEWYKGGRYKKLAPSYQLIQMLKACQQATITPEDINKFARTYNEKVLSKLNPKDVYDELVAISNNKPVVLLSHETADEYSVRYVIKAWFEQAGIECVEIQ